MMKFVVADNENFLFHFFFLPSLSFECQPLSFGWVLLIFNLKIYVVEY